MDHLNDPQAVSWAEMKDELGLTAEEQSDIREGAQELIAQARARLRSGPGRTIADRRRIR
jgi:hypothetical protein